MFDDLNLFEIINIMKIYFLFVSLLLSHLAFLQIQILPSIEVKSPKEKGKAKIYYSLKNNEKRNGLLSKSCDDNYRLNEFINQLSFYENSSVVNWRNSLEKINFSEEYNCEKVYFVETCNYINGKKNGEFSISRLITSSRIVGVGFGAKKIYTLEESNVIIKGNYLNDEWDGVISILNFDMNDKDHLIDLKYTAGILSDQTVILPSIKINYSQQDFMLANYQYQLGFSEYNLRPTYVFKEEKCIDRIDFNYQFIKDKSTSIKSAKLPYHVKYGDTTYYTRYIMLPSCFSEDGMNPPANTFSIESFKLVRDSKNEKYIQGEYRLFLPNSNIFDTSNLIAQFSYVNGRKSGRAIIYFPEVSATSGKNKFIEQILNYKNGYLDGECSAFFIDGPLYLKANFRKGLPIGEAVSYYKVPNKKNIGVLSLNNFAPKWEKTNNEWSYVGQTYLKVPVITEIYQLGNWDASDIEDIKLIREKGGKINELNGYDIYSKVNYKIDSTFINNAYFNISYSNSEFSTFNNGKPMVTYLPLAKPSPWRFNDVLWKDETGKIVYSASQREKESVEKIQEKLKEIENQNNINILCIWCKKKFKFGDRIEINECPCVDRNTGTSTGIILWLPVSACSNDCRVSYEKDCCIKGGKGYE